MIEVQRAEMPPPGKLGTTMNLICADWRNCSVSMSGGRAMAGLLVPGVGIDEH